MSPSTAPMRTLAARRRRGPSADRAIPFHEDRGCAIWGTCLSCPLPLCYEDLAPAAQQRLRRIADAVRRRGEASDG